MELRQGPLGVHLRHRVGDRITTPLVRDDDGELRSGVVVGGPRRGGAPGWRPRAAAPGCWSAAGCTVEDAYAYAKFARMVLGTNDIDFRARAALARRRPSSWPPASPGSR